MGKWPYEKNSHSATTDLPASYNHALVFLNKIGQLRNLSALMCVFVFVSACIYLFITDNLGSLWSTAIYDAHSESA